MGYKIFTLSPGSTSTKCAVFDDDKLLFKENIHHPKEVLNGFPSVNSQRPYRVGVIMDKLHEHGFKLRDMDAYAAYSGGLESTPGRVFPVNEKMLEDASSGRIAPHNLQNIFSSPYKSRVSICISILHCISEVLLYQPLPLLISTVPSLSKP